jgi:hypothetical protein
MFFYLELSEVERLYGKDMDCPEEWNDWLHQSNVVPPGLVPNSEDNLLQKLPTEVTISDDSWIHFTNNFDFNLAESG